MRRLGKAGKFWTVGRGLQNFGGLHLARSADFIFLCLFFLCSLFGGKNAGRTRRSLGEKILDKNGAHIIILLYPF